MYKLVSWPLDVEIQASRNYSIHAIGVLYNKSNEGALYEDGTSGEDKSDDAIQPGGTFTYRWTVPEEMGPRPTDAQCLTRMYLSFVNPTKDRYAGMRHIYLPFQLIPESEKHMADGQMSLPKVQCSLCGQIVAVRVILLANAIRKYPCGRH